MDLFAFGIQTSNVITKIVVSGFNNRYTDRYSKYSITMAITPLIMISRFIITVDFLGFATTPYTVFCLVVNYNT
ncbi:hypothetical protein MACH07_10670 [Flagellimonas marinaquae]|uniref:Uncharacterized protein n=1 Tax=Flagellimonas marinaquae TaxID=254955 RepID=A0AA48HIF8_9FLAO|nr:hypothetical protein MACH07_10670 [Allomuricauda aquimarina]